MFSFTVQSHHLYCPVLYSKKVSTVAGVVLPGQIRAVIETPHLWHHWSRNDHYHPHHHHFSHDHCDHQTNTSYIIASYTKSHHCQKHNHQKFEYPLNQYAAVPFSFIETYIPAFPEIVILVLALHCSAPSSVVQYSAILHHIETHISPFVAETLELQILPTLCIGCTMNSTVLHSNTFTVRFTVHFAKQLLQCTL